MLIVYIDFIAVPYTTSTSYSCLSDQHGYKVDLPSSSFERPLALQYSLACLVRFVFYFNLLEHLNLNIAFLMERV